MTPDDRDTAGVSSPDAPRTLDPGGLVAATDQQLDAIFRGSNTLPLNDVLNGGGHTVDLASRTIFNDEHWKGYLPHDVRVTDVLARLSTGYAKRFWRQRDKVLGETLYLSGRILVKHALEDIELDEVTNDLAPGRYILLRYTDPVFEHVFYDVVRALNDGIIVYRGYRASFPTGSGGSRGC